MLIVTHEILFAKEIADKVIFIDRGNIIEEGKNYNFSLPLISCLSIALRGKPHLAYYLYNINMQMIQFKESIAFLFNRWFRSL